MQDLLQQMYMEKFSICKALWESQLRLKVALFSKSFQPVGGCIENIYIAHANKT